MSASGPRRATNARTDWRTPPELFERLHNEFHFTLDGAASEDNHLLPRFLTPELDAFNARPEGETIFLNPPYGRGLLDWAALAVSWGAHNTVVVLVPAATETRWWARLWWAASECRFLTPRVQFLDPDTAKPGLSSNTGGSAVLVFRPPRQFFDPRTGLAVGAPQRGPESLLWRWQS